MSKALLWFRQDLRLEDNPALNAACEYDELLALYVHDTVDGVEMGRAQQWWLHHSILSLETALKQRGITLCLKSGSAQKCINDLVQQHHIDAVFWNRLYEPAHIQRDTTIKNQLCNQGIVVHSFNGSLLCEPWTIKNKSGHFFKVFTPYWKQCQNQLAIDLLEEPNTWPKSLNVVSEELDSWRLCPDNPNWAKHFGARWTPGILGAQQRLTTFIDDALYHYKEGRNVPASSGTSGLSPHLHFGEISIHTVYGTIEHSRAAGEVPEDSARVFLSELGWREFSYYLLYHFPKLPQQNFRQDFDHFPWKHQQQFLQCWQQGQTGYPIVDAGMRELWQTGYMHNRVRMIVASFLTKDLLIDWRHGADWFWDTLLDADLASNSASWQWVAGCGADAAPYFRIFNPVLQGEKFDPEGHYVLQYVPELNNVPKQWLHKPWEAPSNSLNITLGKDYPKPLVDHRVARELALQSYKSLKS